MENLNTKSRIFRVILGSAMLLNMLTLSTDANAIAAMTGMAFYSLMTALIAWDPLYAVAISIKETLSTPTSKEALLRN
ncbi:MAG: DUF2892 domain-containing protein [Gammaproteobacteria bacterium]|nr:DUF2892 domain-containing protein [Gammaproteobacteria bacterium]